MGTRPPRPTQRFKRGRASRAQMIFGLTPRWRPAALSRSAVKNHRRTIAQLRPGATLTLGLVFQTSQRGPQTFSAVSDLRCSRCLEFIPPVQHRPGRLLLLEYVSTAMAAAHRDAVRAPRHHRKLLLLASAGSALEQVCVHHAPAARSTLGALTLSAPAHAQAQALPRPVREHLLYCRPTANGRPGARALRERRAPLGPTLTQGPRAAEDPTHTLACPSQPARHRERSTSVKQGGGASWRPRAMRARARRPP